MCKYEIWEKIMKIYQIVENIPTPVTKRDAALSKQAKHLKMKSMLAPRPIEVMVGANKGYMDTMAQTKKDADKLSKAAGIDPDYTKKAVANTMKNAKPNARLRAKFGKKRNGGLGETASAGATSAGAIATVPGNGFANGGPGTLKRMGNTKSKKVKNSKKT